jgi:hypothetical protein
VLEGRASGPLPLSQVPPSNTAGLEIQFPVCGFGDTLRTQHHHGTSSTENAECPLDLQNLLLPLPQPSL